MQNRDGLPAGRKENIKVKWSVLCMTELVMNARGGTLYHGLYGEVTPKRGTMQAPGKDFTDFKVRNRLLLKYINI